MRYLSQQFVEELCSSTGLTDGLLREIERVIFEAHPDETRDGALNFAELLDQRASRHRLARAREAEAVTQISDRISTELEKEKLVASYEAEVAKKKSSSMPIRPTAPNSYRKAARKELSDTRSWLVRLTRSERSFAGTQGSDRHFSPCRMK